MAEFIAGAEFIAIFALAAWLWYREHVFGVVLTALMRQLAVDHARCKLWRDQYETLAWQMDDADKSSVRDVMYAADSRIEAELRDGTT